MSFEVSMSESGYIRCRFTEAVTAESARQAGTEVVARSQADGIKRLLVDVRGTKNVETVAGNYDFAYKDLAEIGYEKDMRSAVLVSPGDQSHDFPGTAISNAGYNVRVFESEDEAIAWLNESSPQE